MHSRVSGMTVFVRTGGNKDMCLYMIKTQWEGYKKLKVVMDRREGVRGRAEPSERKHVFFGLGFFFF